MSNYQVIKECLNKKWSILAGAVIVFWLCLIPIIFPGVFAEIALYYGSLFFVILLGASIALLTYVPPRIDDKAENRDFRVIHFILHVALTFAVGAVLIGILLIVFLTIFR
ncbi:hypothetical protein ES703_46055 [subsurface metagenome]